MEKGEVHCLCGENGAGKSTLINLCGGVFTPTEGEICINGVPEQINSIRKSEKLGFAIVHQEVPLCLNMSIAHNIFLGSAEATKGCFLNEKHMNEKTKELMEMFHLHVEPTALLESLSIAEQSIVQIAKAVYFEPEILILDEPTAALTNDQREVMFDVVRKLVKEKQTTVLYVSHRLEEVMELGDRLTVFKDGKFVVTKKVADVTMDDIVTLMVGRQIDKSEWGNTHATKDELLTVKDLCNGKKFQNINFTLHKGEVLGFGGLVGAGRTELMEVIYGAQPLESGQIYYKGQPVKIDSPRKGIKTGIGLVPEDRKGKGLFLDKNVAWNSTINCLDRFAKGTFGLVRTKEVEKEAEKYQKAFNIKTPSLNQLVMNLSGGNQQTVVLAKTMAADAEVIIFDEPTRGIDVGAKQEIYNLMNELAAQGKGILMVSSDMPELLGMCDRIVVISEGRQTGIVDKEDFSQETILSLASISAVKDA